MSKRGTSNGDKGTAAGASVTSLASRRKPPSQKGVPRTKKQLETLAKGTASRKAKAAERREREAREGKQPSRWQQLLAGDITVVDLELDELQRMQTKDALGSFGGKSPDVPAKLAREMKAELLMRGQALIDSSYPEAVALLTSIVRDPRAKHADKIKAAVVLIERGAGRMPETVRVEKTAVWDETFEDGVVTVVSNGRTA